MSAAHNQFISGNHTYSVVATVAKVRSVDGRVAILRRGDILRQDVAPSIIKLLLQRGLIQANGENQ